MEQAYYEYTLNYLHSIGEDLYVVQEGWKSLNSLPIDKSALTPEMESAHKALAAACEEFIKTYSQYAKK